MIDSDEGARRALELCKTIGQQLHGIGPELQSAVLAELTSMWLAGHHPRARDAAWAMHHRLVMDLLKINAKILRGE